MIVIWLSILRIRCEALGCEKHGACDAITGLVKCGDCACEVRRMRLRSAETGLARRGSYTKDRADGVRELRMQNTGDWACEVQRLGLQSTRTGLVKCGEWACKAQELGL